MSQGDRVAFQGELGAFSEEAVYRFFGEEAEAIPRRDFAEVGRAVVEGTVDWGILPIENSLAGSVVASYDVLADGELTIVGEVITPIHHCVLGLPGIRLDELRRILSHPVALAQCTRFLRSLPHVDAVAVYDTAGAAKEVADAGDARQAAIAAGAAAERYGLEVIVRDVEDRTDNQTRFLVVARVGVPLREPAAAAPAVSTMKSAILLEAANQPGSLLRVLTPFANRGINLSKLESRPAGEPWSYRFFIELDAAAHDPRAREALAEVETQALSLQILGSYPRWTEG